MEATMERRSNLVMPTIGYELDREEMSYVDGGLYISGSAITSFMMAATATSLWGNLWAMKSVLAAKVVSFFSWVWAIPVVGPILAIWIGGHSIALVTNFIDAKIRGRGVDLSLSWGYIKMQVC